MYCVKPHLITLSWHHCHVLCKTPLDNPVIASLPCIGQTPLDNPVIASLPCIGQTPLDNPVMAYNAVHCANPSWLFPYGIVYITMHCENPTWLSPFGMCCIGMHCTNPTYQSHHSTQYIARHFQNPFAKYPENMRRKAQCEQFSSFTSPPILSFSLIVAVSVRQHYHTSSKPNVWILRTRQVHSHHQSHHQSSSSSSSIP